MPTCHLLVMILLLASLPLGLGSSACQRPARASVSDSAGVRIIEQAPSRRVSLVGAQPVLQLDGSEGGRDPFFHLNGIVAVADGFVVANSGANELRFYTRDGLLKAQGGKRGRGPGEFGILSWAQRMTRDSLAAWDPMARRLSIWHGAGTHVRDITLVLNRDRPPAGTVAFVPSTAVGILGDGAMLVLGSTGFEASGDEPKRARSALLRYEPGSARVDTLVLVAAIDYQPTTPGSPTREVAFPRMLRWAIGTRGVDVTEGDNYRIERYSPAGEHLRSIRVSRPLTTVSAANREAWLADNTRPDASQAASDPVFTNVFPHTASSGTTARVGCGPNCSAAVVTDQTIRRLRRRRQVARNRRDSERSPAAGGR